MNTFKEKVGEVINSPLSRHLDSRDVVSLASKMRVARFQKGEILFEEGGAADIFYYLIEGRVGVYKRSVDGGEKTLVVIPRGRLVGEMEMLDGEPRCATVRAETQVVALSIANDDFHQILEEQPRIGIAILRAMVRKLSFDLHRMAGIVSSH